MRDSAHEPQDWEDRTLIPLFLLAQAASVGPAEALIALDRKIQAAMVSDDARFLSQALASDFRFTHSGGEAQGKADIVGTAARKQGGFIRREVLDPVAELHGNVGLVFGSLDDARGAARSICYKLNYVHLFVRRAGQWQMLSHRTTEMIKAPAPCQPLR